MASPGSSIRSAARGTFYAYRRVPVRWRLGGGSAALTFVILATFATAVGVLTDRQLTNQFNEKLTASVERLTSSVKPKLVIGATGLLDCTNKLGLATFDPADKDPQVRVLDAQGAVKCTQKAAYGVAGTGATKKQLKHLPVFTVPVHFAKTYVQDGFGAQARRISWAPHRHGYVVFALPLSTVRNSVSEIRIWLALGVFGGTVFALLAGLLVADRAMRPIAQLTDVAREIARTRNPTLSIPHPTAEDEVAELALTLESMLGALDDARNESVSALARQREFVADASHELRTPLTSVLANLELLADELHGEQADSANSALRATRRMRRLVSDLLLLARADVQREQPCTSVDLADSVTEAAAELGPVSEDHLVLVTAEAAPLLGLRDDLHRMVLNLIENAIHHTPAGTKITATSRMEGSTPVLRVEDDGPGIAPEIQDRVFERFVRGAGDTRARGTGLGLSIVSAVADAHDAKVTLTSLPQLKGTRFEVRFPEQYSSPEDAGAPALSAPLAAAQTSTTTGSTMGRRRSRS